MKILFRRFINIEVCFLLMVFFISFGILFAGERISNKQVFMVDPGMEELGKTIKLISKANDSLRITSKDLGEWIRKPTFDSLKGELEYSKQANMSLAKYLSEQTIANLNILNPKLAKLAVGDTNMIVITKEDYEKLIKKRRK